MSHDIAEQVRSVIEDELGSLERRVSLSSEAMKVQPMYRGRDNDLTIIFPSHTKERQYLWSFDPGRRAWFEVDVFRGLEADGDPRTECAAPHLPRGSTAHE